MELLDLRLVLAVGETGAITRGADRVGLALPSASARLRALERELGTALFLRQRRGVLPTPAGMTFIQRSREIVRNAGDLREEMAEYAGTHTVALRLMVNTAAVHSVAGPAVRAFLVAHPRARLDLRERPSSQIVQALLEERIDLGIVSDAVDTFDLVASPLRADPLVALAAADRESSLGKSIRFEEILAHETVGLAAPSALQAHLEQNAARLGGRLSYRVRLPDPIAVCDAVAEGIGIAVLPMLAAAPFVSAGRLRLIRLVDHWAQRRLLLCRHPDTEPSGPVGELSAVLAEHAEQPT